MPEIRVRCECGKGLLLTAEQAGRRGNCPQCNRSVAVPDASAFERLAGRGRISIGELETLGAESTAQRDTGAIVASVGERKTQTAATGTGRARTGAVAAPSSDGAGGLWQPGKVIDDRYEVKEELGSGQFGRVWKVWHNQWRIDLAVKELRTDKSLTENRRKDFLREAQAWVDDIGMHPHVVTAWYVRELEGQHYLFLEYCDGGSLHDWIEQGKTRDLKTALDIGIQLCWGLAHCHEKGIVHRDFKPLNVLMTADGTAKLTDFGTVRFAGMVAVDDDAAESEVVDDIRRTRGGRLQGTPAYMPPEQWAKGTDIDRRADVYALGVTLFEMLTGEFPIRPTKGRTTADWALAHAQDQPHPLSDLRPEVLPALTELIAQCLAKRPESRPESGLAVVDRLQEMYRTKVGEDYPRPKPEEVQPLADTLNNRAVSFLDLRRNELAQETLTEALRVHTGHLESTYNKGLLDWRSGVITDSSLLSMLDNADVSMTQRPLLSQLRAHIHIERGDADAAIQSFKECPDDESSRAAMERLAVSQRHGQRQCLGPLQPESHLSFDMGPRVLCPSDDAKYVLTVGMIARPHGYYIELWDVTTGRKLRRIEGYAPDEPLSEMQQFIMTSPSAACLSANGRFALVATEDTLIRLWDLHSEKCVRTLRGHEDPVNALSLACDGQFAVSGSGGHTPESRNGDETVRLWDMKAGVCVNVLDGHRKRINDLCSVGDDILSASADSRIIQWSIPSGKAIRELQGHDGAVNSLSASKDKSLLVSGGEDGILRCWDLRDGRCTRMLAGGLAPITAVSVSANGEFLLSSFEDRYVRLWFLSTGKCLWSTLLEKECARGIALSSDGSFAVSLAGEVSLWKLSCDHTPAASHLLCMPVQVTALVESSTVFSREISSARAALQRANHGAAARHVKKARGESGCSRRPEAMELWHNLYALLPKRALKSAWADAHLEGHTGRIEAIDVSQCDSAVLASASQDGTVRLWDIRSGSCLRILEAHDGPVNTVSITRDSRLVLSSGSDQTLRLWDAASGCCMKTIDLGYVGKSVCFIADAGAVLTGDCNGMLSYWDLETGECKWRVRAHQAKLSEVTSLAATADGRRAISGGYDNVVRIWDVSTGQCVHECFRHREVVYAVACSRDGRTGISGSGDHRLCVWDLATGRRISSLGNHPVVLCTDLTEDGKYAVSGAHDHSVKFWDVTAQSCVATLMGHTAPVQAICLSRGERFMFSAGGRLIQRWCVDWDLQY